MFEKGVVVVINRDLVQAEIKCGDVGEVVSGPSGDGWYNVAINGNTWIIHENEMDIMEGEQSASDENTPVQTV